MGNKRRHTEVVTNITSDDSDKEPEEMLSPSFPRFLLLEAKGCTVVYMLVIGGAKSYGLLYTELLDYFGASASETGWISSINFFLTCALAPLSNALAKRYSFRWVTFTGGVLAGTGFVLSSIVPTMNYMYLTIGVISGVGFGLALSPSATLVSYFFNKHRFLANGVTFSSSGLCAITLSFVYDYLVATFGLRGTLLIIGGINFQICVGACFFIQPDEFTHDKKTSTEETGESRATCELIARNARSMFEELKLHLKLFRMPTFTMFQIVLALLMYSYTGGLVLLAAEVDYRDLTKVQAAINVAVFGTFDVVGRIFFGWFTDLKLMPTRYIYVINIGLGATFTILVPCIKTLMFIRIYAGALGLFLASYMALLPPYLIESFGLERFSQGMGLSYMSMAFGLLIGHPTLGLTADITGNWNAAFLLCGVLLIIGALVLAAEPYLSRLCSKREKYVVEESNQCNTKL